MSFLSAPCAPASSTARTPAPVESDPSPPQRSLLREIALVVAAVVAYFGARGLTEADPSVAIRHAQRVVNAEKAVDLFHEPALQRLVLPYEGVLDVLNWIYIWGHWPVIALVLLWLARRHRPAFVVLRNALIISGLIGIVIFTLYPVAPPRLAGLGLMDSITQRSHSYRVLQPPAFVNQYAALPSLHVGWDLLIGVTLVRHAGSRLFRGLGFLLPLAMMTAVVLTANHYIVDGLLGAAVALTGLWAAERLVGHHAPTDRPRSGAALRLPRQRCEP